MTTDRQERIRNRAHQIWIDEGKPFHQHERHWEQAIADINREDADASAPTEPAAAASSKKPARSKDAAKPVVRKPKRADT